MLLSRFWYVVLALALGASLFTLYLAQSMFNRAGARTIAEGLSSDSQVVSWYLRGAARERSAHLIKFALAPKIVSALAKSTANPGAVPKQARQDANSALTKLAAGVPKVWAFDILFAVDRHGRVVGQMGYPPAEANPHFELGGYPLVADALRGYVRDGSFAWNRLHTAVARPVEMTAGGVPIGAVVGLRTVDERFADAISKRTGAAVAFFRNGERVAAGVPETFLKSDLDGIIADIKTIAEDKDYVQKGRSKLRYLTPNVGAVYSKLPGETWAVGAGYVVGRKRVPIDTPLAFFKLADDRDKASADWLVVGGATALALVLGLLLTVLEHTRPLSRFRRLTAAFAAGKADQIQASGVGGLFRKIAMEINDGVDHAVAKGGGSRRAADLQSVLGDVPDEPAMSAFSIADPPAAAQSSSKAVPMPPTRPGALPEAPPSPAIGVKAQQLSPNQPMTATQPEAGLAFEDAVRRSPPAAEELEEDWQAVFAEFVETKRNCGEGVQGLTYAKFEGTLRKNQKAIQERHGVTKVKFKVYVKAGRAALKASPIRG